KWHLVHIPKFRNGTEYNFGICSYFQQAAGIKFVPQKIAEGISLSLIPRPFAICGAPAYLRPQKQKLRYAL
ncbi:MAG: hypothetical protein LBC41_12465, partial [Clostridiales bacterium]|nr:hypothetical protein [Clostridiales bacterium]